jgi:hypothetical protein
MPPAFAWCTTVIAYESGFPVLRGAPLVRFAYADPPYPGQAKRLYGDHPDYGGEVDHRELVDHLVSEYPDGWALSTGAKWLREIVMLCPLETRVLAWCKPGPPFSTRIQYTWEPVFICGGRPWSKGDSQMVKDSLYAPPHTLNRKGWEKHHVTGAKPPVFCRWIFECLGALPGDVLDDIFPGSGAVGHEWNAWIAQPKLEAA